MVPGRFVPTNPDLGDMLRRKDLHFEITYVVCFFSITHFQISKFQYSRFPKIWIPRTPYVRYGVASERAVRRLELRKNRLTAISVVNTGDELMNAIIVANQHMTQTG